MIIRYGFALAGVVVGWVGVLASVMALGGASPGALVVLPSPALLSQLPDGYAITGANHFAIVVTGEGEVARTLYARGAILVLPAGLAGCAGIFATNPTRNA